MDTSNKSPIPWLCDIPLRTAQVLLLSGLWIITDYAHESFRIPVPTGLVGLLILAFGLFSGIVKVQWIRLGAGWLISEMTLFFVPALLAVSKYQDLMRQEGVRIFLVMILGTVVTMIVIAIVVEYVYRLELRQSGEPKGDAA